MLVISLVFAAVLFGVACLAFHVPSQAGRGTAFLVFGVVIFIAAGCILNVPLFFQGIVLVLIGLLANSVGASFKTFARAAALGTVAVFVAVSLFAIPPLLERMRLREEYPFESLSARLSYERTGAGRKPEQEPKRQRTQQAESISIKRDLSPSEVRLVAFEEAIEEAGHRYWRDRANALRLIHTSHVEQFIDSPGFGVGRMARMTNPKEYADIDTPETVQLPPANLVDTTGTPPDFDRPEPVQQAPAAPEPTERQLLAMYEWGLTDFVNRRGWGYVQDRDHVAGFQAHGFRRIPPLVPGAEASSNFQVAISFDERGLELTDMKRDENWQIIKLELVSLLTHDDPCVYVSSSLPRMDRVDDYPVRPLTGFEEHALRGLRSGEDVVSESSINLVRMLGAIRAVKQCLRCHQVERGELLGAFSYVLQRTEPIRKTEERREPLF